MGDEICLIVHVDPEEEDIEQAVAQAVGEHLER